MVQRSSCTVSPTEHKAAEAIERKVVMSIRRLMTTAAGGLVIAFGAAVTSPLQGQGTPDDLNKDSELIREFASDHLLEIRLGTLAKDKASNASVKDFGDRMVRDHTMLLENWRALVKQSGFPFQPGLRDEQEDELKRLEKVSGTEFDRAYMTAMVSGHQDAVAKAQRARSAAKSELIRARVGSDLPILEQHLSLATQVAAGGNVAVTPTPNPTTPSPTAPAPSQNAPVAAQPTAGQEDLSRDRYFIREAVQDNTLEVKLGQLAQRKASDPAVKEYTQQVVSDHTKMQNQWVTLAARNGMTLHTKMGPKHKEKAQRLEKLSGKEFDRAYMTMQVQNQQDYVEYFGKEGKATNASQVRDLAANDLRSLELHLSQAKDVASRVGVNVAAALRARRTAAYRSN
jgi:putative membrane protein